MNEQCYEQDEGIRQRQSTWFARSTQIISLIRRSPRIGGSTITKYVHIQFNQFQCLHKETSERRTRHGTCLHPAETRLLNSARSTAIAPKVSSHEDRNRAAASEFQRVTEGDRAHSYGDHDLSRGPSCRPRRASLSFSKYVDESQQTITTASAQRSATRIREPHS